MNLKQKILFSIPTLNKNENLINWELINSITKYEKCT